MELKEFKKLKVGDKVRIVKEKPDTFQWVSPMNKWLGVVMTVRNTHFGKGLPLPDVQMEEDLGDNFLGQGWYWYPEMIEEVVEKKEETIVIKSDGKTVTAYCGKDKGVAVCSPDDEFDLYTGAKLALDRLFGKEEKPEKEKKSGLEPIDISWSGVLYFKDMDTGEYKKLSDVKKSKRLRKLRDRLMLESGLRLLNLLLIINLIRNTIFLR